MSSADEIWEWIRTPLEELKRDLVETPDKAWETRRAEFLELLGLVDPGQHPMVEQFLRYLDELTEEDRTGLLGSDQVDAIVQEQARQYAVDEEPAQEQAVPADGPGYDEQAWQAYLTENGPHWDGTDDSWDQFAQWFLYYAGERSLKDPATALLDYLAAQPAAERIATLAQYGVVIGPAATPDQGEPAVFDQDIDAIMADALAADPGLADIPEERRREIMAEVLGAVRS